MNSIIFDRIHISGFLSMGEADVDLKEQGFVLVNGKNKETSIVQSNGSGKSTIFDAIFWTLCGETLRGASEVVNEKTSSGCLCKLDFHTDDKSYTIVRTKSHPEYGNSCSFYIDEELVTDQIKKSQEMISKTIPSVSSPEILGSIILLGQGLPYKFSSFSPTRRKDMLETMSGSDSEISKVKYKLDIKETDHTATMNSIKSRAIKATGLISGHEGTLEILRQQMESMVSTEDATKEIKNYEDLISDARDIISDLELKLQNQREVVTSLIAAFDDNKNLTAQYKNSLSSIVGQLSSIKSGNCPTCGRPFEVTEEVARQKAVLEQKKSQFELQISALQTKSVNLQERIGQANDLLNSYSNIISVTNYKISDHQSKIKNLTEQAGRSSDLSNQIKDIETKITGLRININEDSKLIDSEREVLECIGYLKRQLSRDFKGYMLTEVIKFMSSRSEYYSQYLFTNDKKIEVSLSGNKILITVGGRLYENLSGGERQRVDLAVQFSLRDMLVMTTGFSCNLLVLDEAFDNLDAQGSDALIKLVVSEFSDIDSVFVITHHAEIDIPYDKQITVVKESDGISRLR